MSAVEKFLSDRGVQAAWDETTCQDYAQLQEGDSFYQVWLENARSLEAKMNIMRKYEIGGVAAWKLGYEKDHPEIWGVLSGFANG